LEKPLEKVLKIATITGCPLRGIAEIITTTMCVVETEKKIRKKVGEKRRWTSRTPNATAFISAG
jgi:hypothetical protein